MATLLVGGIGLYMLGSNYNDNSIKILEEKKNIQKKKQKK